uniref:Helicase ATP-binding domain-containing protein n=1 Tax=Oryza brachyantha TaxID=4533 RepID=J3L6F8_ORYBR
MGLGKTVQVVCFLYHIIRGGLTASPALILAPKSILLQCEKEFGHWASDLNVIVYQGDKDSRKYIQVHEMYSSEGKPLFDALVTSYEFVQIDKAVLQKFKWSSIVIDEAHRMKKLDCNLAACLKRYCSEFRLLLTGTPLQNNIMELFSLLHYIDPDEFSDPKTDGLFSPIESERDLTMDEKIARIHDILKPRMLRRMKSDVLTDSMPIKKWVQVPCALTDSQRELYINILEKNYTKLNSAILNGFEVGQQASQDVFHSLVASSGKLQLLHKLLPRLKERGNRVLIFSQMIRMLDILEVFLCSLGYKYARIGQTPLSARQESIKEYNNNASETFIFLMSTRAGGLGFDLPGADRVIIYDPDFNPFMDLQAQSRAHRIGQTRPVVVYQLITKCTVEEKILQKSKQKLAIENMLMNSSQKPSADELQSILLYGAKTIVDRKKVSATSIHYDDEAIENLLKLDPSSGEKCSSDNNGYLGSIVSFAHGVEDEVPSSPKVDDLCVLKPATPKVDLGRGKRKRKVVNYADEVENEDSDDMYAPEGSSTSESSSSDDDETDRAMQLQIVPVPDS